MTQEEKLKEAKRLYQTANADQKYVLESLFPELKESEDDRISREITEFILTHRIDEPNDIEDTNAWLAWLEKQGDEKEYTFKSIPRLLEMVEPTERAKAYCQKLIDALTKEGYVTDAKIVEECLKKMNGEQVALATMDDQKINKSEDERIRKAIIDYLMMWGYQEDDVCGVYVEDAVAWLEKQGKQEEPQVYETEDGKIITYSENEGYKVVEPKFHGGEWITNGIEIVQITGYDIDYGYQVDYKGNLQHRDTDIIEKNYHLWTIQDAEDGDVLANDNNIIILKELGYTWASDGNPENLYAYCGIKPDGNFEIEKENYCFCGLLHIHPATKEQHDLLFKKMKEAGYEWDSGKKELIRIENQIEDFDWLNIVDAACDECYINAYASGEYCHHQSFKWGFQEGVKWMEEQK